jgi:hypothetical protein
MSRDGEHLGVAANQQDLVVAHMAGELSIAEVRERNALGEVGAARRGLILRHVWSP